jgi:glutaredoxin
MRPSPNLLQHGIRLTLFSGKGCSLCHSAKEILAKVHQRRPFEYQEVDTGAKGQEQWRNLYQFDIPVLHAAANPDLVTYTKIIMHRFSEKEVEALMDEAVA